MILGLSGGLGSGKTLIASMLATSEAARGRPVWANYALVCATVLRSWDELVQLESGVVVLDEAHVEIDSRAFANNIQATSFLLQTRKLGLDLVYTTQGFDQVDKRLRTITDLLGMCERVQWPNGMRASRCTLIRLPEASVIGRPLIVHTPALYALYDTHARVFPLTRSKNLGLSHQ